MMTSPKDCPVLATQQHIDDLSHEMALALRQLRYDLTHCDSCILSPEDCPLRQELSSAVNIAIQEVCDEWNLVSQYRRDAT